jgi:glyoxylase-like metal-dependent hydrolase (beta-lactamase superfamily II)
MTLPQPIFEQVYRFKPNRATGGGSSYLIQHPAGNILIDSPAFHAEHCTAIDTLGGVQQWIFTHRGGIGEVELWMKHFQPQITIHEQEAFLVNSPNLNTFSQDTELLPDLQILWTPGHSPGSSCVLYRDMLFTGRHLLPNRQGEPSPFRLAKTFHWPRQLRSVEKLLQESISFSYICPGAGVGLLRGAVAITDAQTKLRHVWNSAH